MATLKYKTKDGEYKTLDMVIAGGGVTPVQTTGDSETDVMSQKAVTEELNKKLEDITVTQSVTSGTTLATVDGTSIITPHASTSKRGIVQLSSSTSSSSLTTAATSSAVKSAFELASTATTNAANAATAAAAAQSTADSAASAAATAQSTANGKWTYNASTIAGVKVNNAGYADSAGVATGVSDYGSTSSTILIGYTGNGLTSSTCSHLAGYTDGGKKIKDISAAEVKTWLGLGSNAYNSTTIPTNTNQLTNGAGFITSYTDTKNTAGSTNSTSKLYLIGAGSQAANAVTYSNSSCYMQSGYLYATSDERLKNFENDVTIDFNVLKSIPKKYFRWKENPENLNIGTSAQALQKVYPELVTTDENGEMGVNYQHLSVVALAAIDKLHEENLELKERIERLESKIK